ncbi:hypothetical protein LTS12_029174, partial [Elasticomyces elasticus]
MSRVQTNAYVCKLRLLQYGLVDECGAIDESGSKKGGKNKSAKDGEDSSDEEDDEEDVIEKRNTYVKKCIREAHASGRLKAMMAGAKNPIAAEQRRTVIKDFFKDLVSFKKCANCSGDRFSKIFRKALPEKSRLAMVQAGLQAPNSLILLQQAKQFNKKEKHALANETHGAEEEVARGNAVVSQLDEKRQSSGDTQQFMPSPEIYAAMVLLFEKEGEILNLVYSSRPISKNESR